jgi:restriction system protein
LAIPDFQSVMLPLLRSTVDREEHSLSAVTNDLAEHFELTEEETEELIPSGRAKTFKNRVGWANTYLKKAGLLEAPRRGYLTITPRGIEILEENPERVDMVLLNRFPEFVEFRSRTNGTGNTATAVKSGVESTSKEETPEEIMESAHRQIRDALAAELLQQIMSCSPAFFENLVVDLLVAMGYGGTRSDAGRSIGRSGDEGIDGIINEDRLGLDIIYIQAKRWQAPVSRPEIQKFVGALQGKRARRGVFITTSSSTDGAADYASNIENRVILVDGKTLSNLMIDHGVGVSTAATYSIRRIDSDYFDEL